MPPPQLSGCAGGRAAPPPFDAIAGICTVPTPDGAFYCLARVHTPLDPLTLVKRLIAGHRVSAVPGTAFGLDGCSLRVAYGALDAGTVAEGMERLVGGLRAIVGG